MLGWLWGELWQQLAGHSLQWQRHRVAAPYLSRAKRCCCHCQGWGTHGTPLTHHSTPGGNGLEVYEELMLAAKGTRMCLHGSASSASCSSSATVFPTCYLCMGLALDAGSMLPLTACTSLCPSTPMHTPLLNAYMHRHVHPCAHTLAHLCVCTSHLCTPTCSTPTYLPLHLNSHTPLYAHAHTNTHTPATCTPHAHINACTSMHICTYMCTPLYMCSTPGMYPHECTLVPALRRVGSGAQLSQPC